MRLASGSESGGAGRQSQRRDGNRAAIVETGGKVPVPGEVKTV